MTLTFLHLGSAVILMVTCLGVHGFEWTSDLADFSVKDACHGGLLQLPWNYNSAPGDNVISIRWFFKGVSEQLIAFSFPPHFAPMAAFSSRVQRHNASLAGIVLSHVTRGDTGNYSVRVSGHTGSGTAFTFNRTVLVQVMDENTSMTTDGELHAMLEPQAIYSNTTSQWSLVVSCGHFTFPGDPLFDMEWTTPSGAVVPSDGYKDGYFQLHVTSGGDYTCTIPQHAAADLCLHSNSTYHAVVQVNNVEARLTLVEARQKQLQAANERLEQKNEQLMAKDLKLEAKDSDLTQQLNTLRSRFDLMNDSFLHSLQILTRKYDLLNASLSRMDFCGLEDYSVLDDSRRSVENNQSDLCDSSLTSGWYRFRLDGSEAVIPTSCVPDNHCGTNAPFWLDLQGGRLPAVGEVTVARACAHWENNCCRWEAPITVRNCGSFFVYKLTPISNCYMAYCVQPANS